MRQTNWYVVVFFSTLHAVVLRSPDRSTIRCRRPAGSGDPRRTSGRVSNSSYHRGQQSRPYDFFSFGLGFTTTCGLSVSTSLPGNAGNLACGSV